MIVQPAEIFSRKGAKAQRKTDRKGLPILIVHFDQRRQALAFNS
jgi:hypothetical protein